MVDIQSATAEIRRGIKNEETTGKNIISASACYTQGGHNKEQQNVQKRAVNKKRKNVYIIFYYLYGVDWHGGPREVISLRA